MSDFPDLGLWLPPQGVLSTAGEGSPVAGALLATGNAFNTTAVMPGALIVVYSPILIPNQITVRQAAWLNGATVAGNVDCGIYDEQGNKRIATGSTLMAGVSVPQVVDIADTTLEPGNYYIAFVSDSATANFQRGFVTAQLARACGMRQQTLGAMPLPATATFATNAASTLPLVSFPFENAVF